MSFFSVVIPVYNKGNHVGETLQSVLEQSFLDFEIIIIDDGSTDHSRSVIKQFADPRIQFYHQSNQGASYARNFGVQQSRSEWIALLDADDFWNSNHLQELYNCIQKFPKADIISNAYEVQLSHDFVKKPNYSKPIPNEAFIVDDYFSYSLIDPLFWTSSMAFKKIKFINLGGFDSDLKTGQDLDLIIRFALNSILAYNPVTTLKYKRYTENNLSLTTKLEEKKKYIDKNKVYEKSNSSLKKYLDINRFSLALQSKLQNDRNLYRSSINDINFRNLNIKQKILLKLPGYILVLMKILQKYLIKLGIYRTAFN